MANSDPIIARRYNTEYFRMVRRLKLEPHPFNKQTCCSACRRTFNREHMRKLRAKAQHLVDKDLLAINP